MRNYARLPVKGGGYRWAVVSTDANGFNDLVYLSNLIQVLQLELGESPFFANVGIPAQESILQQVWPDFYVAQVQQQFAQYFVSLTISKQSGTNTPTYNIFVITHSGANINFAVNASTGVLATETGAPISIGGFEIQV